MVQTDPIALPPTVTPEPQETPASRDPLPLLVAFLAIAGFGVFVAFLLTRLGLDDLQWTRATYLLNGVEAIAFAAAGFLFGREVQRGRAESAERRAENAEAVAKGTQEDAAKGRSLATMVMATAAVERRSLDVTADGATFSRSTATGADMSALVRAAEGLFPDAGR
ncbi:MAG TPA: hypothetical protein VJ885_15155 [Thermoanaerobaculia bacterium]|jgi:hypothetical protein|nr:hypothetical protein [Thermoanaerobaculia bacterium]